MSENALDRLARRLERKREELAAWSGEKRYLVVVVDDEKSNLEALSRLLSERYDVRAFSGGDEALAAIRGGLKPDLVVTDQRMPTMTGVELLARVRELQPQCMRLILSGYSEKSDLIAAINKGYAYQYLTKPWHSDDLLVAIGQALDYYQLVLERQRLNSELEESNAKLAKANAHLEQLVQQRTHELRQLNDELQVINDRLRQMAASDALTGIYNHGYFKEFLAKELRRSVRYRNAIGVIMADVDHFKFFNDTNGHQVGDQALRAVAMLLRSGLREMDMVARYGGEEFVIVLPQTDLAGAAATAERLRKVIEAHSFHGGHSQPRGRLTLSFGVAAYQPGEPSADRDLNLQDLIERADRALYQSKRDGRNRIAVAADERPPAPDDLQAAPSPVATAVAPPVAAPTPAPASSALHDTPSKS